MRSSGLMWESYVDRPSPLYMAPGIVTVGFDADGRVKWVVHSSPVGGCK
jgi:hypothetical protein